MNAPSPTGGLRITHKFAGALGSLLPQAGEGLGMRVFVKAASLAIALPCRARTGLQACAATQARSMLHETPASPPALSRLRERESSWPCKDV